MRQSGNSSGGVIKVERKQRKIFKYCLLENSNFGKSATFYDKQAYLTI